MNVALITGASSGIGESAAKLFVDRGWHVCATARHPENLGAWSRGHQVIRVPLDVTDPVSVHTAVQECLHVAGRIDVLINNAGIGMAGPLEAMSVEDIERHFQTNFFGAIRMIQAVVPHFRVQNKGTVVNVSSVAGRFGVPFLSPYCAGKFALEGLSESLYYELAPFNNRILGSHGYVLRRCVRSGAEFVSQRTEFSVASKARYSLLRRGRPSDATLL